MRPARRSPCRSPRPPVGPRRGRASRRRRRPLGVAPPVDGILVALKPAGPTSHDVVALVRRLAATKRVGHGGTLDPFASGVLPVFLGRATRVVEYHLGDRKGYRATVCFGASSTTDDLEGELTPGDGPRARLARRSRRRWTASAGPISQRPPAYSAIKVAGRRAYALARAGESVELAPARRDDPPARARRVGRLRPGPPDRDPRRRVLRGHVHPGARARPRRGASAARRTSARSAAPRAGRSGSRRRSRSSASGRPPPTGPERLPSLLLPIDAGPRLAARARHHRRGGRRDLARPVHPAPRCRRREPEAPIRVRDGAGRLVAIATVRDGRLAPDKVLVDAPAGDATAGGWLIRASRSSPAVEGSRPEHGPLFAVIGVFDGIHLGHRYLLGTLVEEARGRAARPAVITFDSHPDEILVGAAPPLLLDPAERLRMLGEAGVEVVVVQHFDAALRTTEYDAFVRRITARTRSRGPADDAGRGIRPRPARDAGRGPGPGRGRRVRSRRRAAVRRSTAARSGAPTSARRSPRATC